MDRRKKLLVVDDEAPNRELLEALLTGMGHDVEMAADGASALAMLDASHDLVLLDVMMAGMDGYEVARRIRNESSTPDIPICMVTALSDKEDRLRAVEAGASDFISKPVDKIELAVRSASLLKVKTAQDAVKQHQADLAEKNGLLQESFEKLSELGDLKDEFLRIASHDLRSPLQCILGFAALLQSEIPAGAAMTGDSQGWVVKIATHCRTMQTIIEDFLDFQAIEDGQIKLRLEEIDMNALLRDAVERSAGYAATKKIGVHAELKPGALLVKADRSRISQVIENFINNALKFSEEGEDVTLSTHKVERGLLVEIRDSGPGIQPEDMNKLFVKYAKLGNAPTGGEKSSGLGLAICKKIIDMHEGTTGARNNAEGDGTTFWFELPVQASNSAERPNAEIEVT